MTTAAPTPADVLEKVGALGPPGTPVTTPEVAEGFDCTKRTIYNRLDSLAEDGVLQTKKVGANSRVWWRPAHGGGDRRGGNPNGGELIRVEGQPDWEPTAIGRDSEMAERIREFDWAETPLGPIEEWPAELRVAVDIMLGTSEAIGIYWGDDLTLLYNDAARAQIGTKHPDALGQPAREVFPEAWETLGPMHEQVMAGEGAVRVEEQYLPIERGDDIENVWFDSSFNPIPCADASVGGVFNVSVEVTDRVQAESALQERQRESERRYRTVLNSMDEGFFLADVVFDRDGEPLDILYRDSNPAAIEMTGEAFEGRWLTEIDTEYEEYWYEVFGRVASTGESERHELYAEPDGRWYDIHVFKPEGAGSRRVAGVFEDITERKEAEEQLRESEQRLDAFVTTTTDLVYRMSPDWSEVYSLDGDPFIEVDEQRTERWLTEYIPEDEQERVADAIEAAVETKDLFDLEHEVFLADGTRGWARSRGVPILDDDGEIVEWFGTAINITERKEQQQELRETRELLEVALDVEEMGVWELDLQTRESPYRSPRHDEIFGYDDPVDDWSLERALDHFHPDDREAVREQFDAALESGNWEFESRIIRADGEQRWIRAKGTFFYEDETPIRGVGTVQDITERKEAEAALRESEQRLRLATDIADIAVFEWDLETDLVIGNERMHALFGYGEDETIVGEELLGERIHPDDLESVNNQLEAVFESESSGDYEFEFRALHPDGSERWVLTNGEVIFDGDGDDRQAVRVHGTGIDITERKEAEQQLRESEERYRMLFESIIEGFCTIEVLFDEDNEPVDYRFLETNPAFEDQTGLVDAEGKRMKELEPNHEDHWFEMYGRIAKTGESERFTNRAKHLDDRWYDVHAFRVGDPEERKVAIAFKDISDSKHYQIALERLNATTREFLDSGPETIRDRVAGLVREVLNVEYAALWRYDDQRGDLEEHAVDTAPDVDIGAVSPSTELSELVWQTFVGTDVDVATDLDSQDGTWGSLESRVLVPLGRHGVVCLGSTRAGTFDERTVDLVEMVAATVETAWDRAAGEAELADRNEELARLDRLNTLIREIDQALVAADTREEIDDAVCERLADSDLYEFAWIGDHNPGTDSIEPRAWAGVDSGYLEDLEITVEDTPTNRDPIARAVRTGDLQVVADIATDNNFAPWREATLERGARSLVCIPLVYDETVYGVLTVYADRPQSDEDERNQEVLSELGDTIAHTINATETRATLQTDSVVELTLRFDDADTPLCRLARETDCTVEHQGFVPRTSGQADVFFIARAVNPAELQAAAEGLLAFESVQCLTEREDGSLFRVRVSDPTLAARFTDAGAVVRSITIDAGVATAVVDIPHTAAVRGFLDQLREWNQDFELLTRQSRERPLKTRQTFVAALEDRLTDRQREVLQTAYLSGFFEVPRVSNGKEVTELLGVSQPTFSEHLRAAQRRLCEVVFESGSPADVSELDEARS